MGRSRFIQSVLRKVARARLRLLSTTRLTASATTHTLSHTFFEAPEHHAHMGCLHEGWAKAVGVRVFRFH